MRTKDIELANISRFRGELMGAAMLFIILFHVGLPRTDLFFGLRRCGNIGVDIFLFLSGVGLWFSWVKQPSTWSFYRRRLLRILPAWLIMASLYYIPRFNPQTGSIIDLIGNITINWNFWLHDELTFWYIPAIMMLYLWAPPYMKLITKHPIYRWSVVLMVLWCVMVQWIIPVHHAVGHLEIFWSRVPIFFLGINFGEMVRREVRIDGAAVWLVLITFVACFASCIYLEQVSHGRFPLFVERMIYIPLTLTAILLLNRIFRRLPQRVNRFWAFFGGLSLEAYLIHNHFVMAWLSPYHLGYWPTSLLTIVLTIPLAWLLHQFVKRLLQWL